MKKKLDMETERLRTLYIKFPQGQEFHITVSELTQDNTQIF
jgi:hypothetical protein